jgi:hypothetical protein
MQFASQARTPGPQLAAQFIGERQVHIPLSQVSPGVHCVPHAPQWSVSAPVLTQVPPQRVWPASHVGQVPVTQLPLGPLHSVWPSEHWHAPLLQWCPPTHAGLEQPPQ